MTDFYTPANLVIAIFGLIVAIIGIVYARRALSFSKRIARAEKTFGRSELGISINGKEDVSEIIITGPLDEESVFIVPVHYLLYNQGDRDATDIEIHITASKVLCPTEGVEFDQTPKTIKERTQYKIVSQTEHLATRACYFEKIKEKTAMDFRDILRIQKPTMNIFRDIKEYSKNNVLMNVKVNYSTPYVLKFWITCSEYSSLKKSIKISIFNSKTHSLNDYLGKVSEHMKKEHKKEYDSLGFKGKIKYFFTIKHPLKKIERVHIMILDPNKVNQIKNYPLYECPEMTY